MAGCPRWVWPDNMPEQCAWSIQFYSKCAVYSFTCMLLILQYRERMIWNAIEEEAYVQHGAHKIWHYVFTVTIIFSTAEPLNFLKW